MKSTLTGYIIPSVQHLKTLTDDSIDLVLIHQLRTWVLKDVDTSLSAIDRIDTPVGEYHLIPVGADSTLSYDYDYITVNTSTTSLNFKNLSKCVELDLSINTHLELVNILKHSRYILKINFNNNYVENIADLLIFPSDVDWEYFQTNYEYLILELCYIDKLYSRILFAKLNDNVPVAYQEHTLNTILDLPLWYEEGDQSINSYSATVSGSPSFSEGVTLNQGNLQYAVDSAFNLNEVDFSIEAFIRFYNSTDYGTILARWNDYSRQFWVRIDREGVLRVSFNEGVHTVELSYDLTSHLSISLDFLHILVIKSHNIYKLFLDGELVDSVKSQPFMSVSTAPVVVGKLENSPLTGDVGNTSFKGIVREVRVTKSIKNNYPFAYVYPKDTLGLDLLFSIQNGLLDKVSNQLPFSVSTVATEPVLGVGNRRLSSLGNYNHTILNKKHHLEYTGHGVSGITTEITVEGWIKNKVGNTRGTIVYYGDTVNCNFHIGIYDNTLKVDVKNAAFSLTSNSPVVDDIWTHFAYVREGSDNRLYINGLYTAGGNSSEDLLFYGTNLPLYIKRGPSQNLLEASVNTSLYPSKSLIELEGLRISKQALYTGISSETSNFLLPGEFSYR